MKFDIEKKNNLNEKIYLIKIYKVLNIREELLNQEELLLYIIFLYLSFQWWFWWHFFENAPQPILIPFGITIVL